MRKILLLILLFVLSCAPSFAEEKTGPCDCGVQVAVLDEDEWDEHERREEDREREKEDEWEEEEQQEDERKSEIIEEH